MKISLEFWLMRVDLKECQTSSIASSSIRMIDSLLLLLLADKRRQSTNVTKQFFKCW